MADEQDDEKKPEAKKLTITAPNMPVVTFKIRGTAPYVQNKFSKRKFGEMAGEQEEGDQGKKKTKRKPRDFKRDYEEAMHRSEEGWFGIPATAFRKAMVDACRVAGLQMTLGKLCVFVKADGVDPDDMTPLVRITKGRPHCLKNVGRNANGSADIRVRPMWNTGWEAQVRVEYDGDLFEDEDIANLLHRVGKQVGVGEGRPFSKMSTGMGWGTFELV
jgi:hypothetical protein